jgi:hypothetical protein
MAQYMWGKILDDPAGASPLPHNPNPDPNHTIIFPQFPSLAARVAMRQAR